MTSEIFCLCFPTYSAVTPEIITGNAFPFSLTLDDWLVTEVGPRSLSGIPVALANSPVERQGWAFSTFRNANSEGEASCLNLPIPIEINAVRSVRSIYALVTSPSCNILAKELINSMA